MTKDYIIGLITGMSVGINLAILLLNWGSRKERRP